MLGEEINERGSALNAEDVVVQDLGGVEADVLGDAEEGDTVLLSFGVGLREDVLFRVFAFKDDFAIHNAVGCEVDSVDTLAHLTWQLRELEWLGWTQDHGLVSSELTLINNFLQLTIRTKDELSEGGRPLQ